LTFPIVRPAKRHPRVIVDSSASSSALLKPVPVDAVTLTDTFWAPRIARNRVTTIPGQYELLATTGRLENFKRVAGPSDKAYEGIFFNDSDVYKWLEAAAWSLATHPDPDLDALCDEVIWLIGAAQDSDGYLDTYFSLERKRERWSNLKDMHELYCAGHFIQAAVAHYRATGKRTALDIAQRLADCICCVFGDGPGQKRQTDGHEEIEMALVELSRTTGESKYLRQSQFFIDVRGHKTIGGGEYHQDHIPIREMSAITGHAVRAVYYNCGAADVALETGDTALIAALERLWSNMIERRSYVSGGIGSRWEGEAFGRDYELPNERAYTETCAAIGSVMWSWRMLLLQGEAKYADLIEHTLYNAVLPGLSLDGQSYFYQNPLADDGHHRREPWFGCACCPPNVARLLASLTGYFYSTSEDAIWVHLYAAGEARIDLGGNEVVLRQITDYPWDGSIRIEVDPTETSEFAINVRIPAWASSAMMHVGDERIDSIQPGAYAAIRRKWRKGDSVEIDLPMPVRRVRSHPFVLENTGRAALFRGPLLYCIESVDNPGVDLRTVSLPVLAELTSIEHHSLLGGVVAISGSGLTTAVSTKWTGSLYRSEAVDASASTPVQLLAVPYYAWANREAGQMQVWIREDGSSAP
jgi:uncharacterized protein